MKLSFFLGVLMKEKQKLYYYEIINSNFITLNVFPDIFTNILRKAIRTYLHVYS
jgi:hypothetical protein